MLFRFSLMVFKYVILCVLRNCGHIIAMLYFSPSHQRSRCSLTLLLCWSSQQPNYENGNCTTLLATSKQSDTLDKLRKKQNGNLKNRISIIF